VVEGVVAEEEAWIDAPIGRDPRMPSRMAVQPTGREAQTGFTVLDRLEDSTLLVVRPRTGRTHQIRVHCRYIKHPVVGDPVYGRRQSAPPISAVPDSTTKGAGEASYLAQVRSADAPERRRMMLHAWRLGFEHPETGEALRFEAPIPAEFPEFPYDELPWIDTPARK